MDPMTMACIASILVVALVTHELGHVLGARLLGIRVAEVGIGLPPRIGALSWRGFELSLNWIPLGAFVRYHERTATLEGSSLGDLPAWQRLIVTLAGPFANLGVAAVALAVETTWLGALTPLSVWILSALAFLSIAIGATNLIPIPPLDGSKVLFLTIETARGHRLVSQQVQARVDRAALFVTIVAFAGGLVFGLVGK